MSAPQAPPTCVRCKQTLPRDSQFCVACGFHNEDAMIANTFDAVKRYEQRKRWEEFTEWLARLFRGF